MRPIRVEVQLRSRQCLRIVWLDAASLFVVKGLQWPAHACTHTRHYWLSLKAKTRIIGMESRNLAHGRHGRMPHDASRYMAWHLLQHTRQLRVPVGDVRPLLCEGIDDFASAPGSQMPFPACRECSCILHLPFACLGVGVFGCIWRLGRARLSFWQPHVSWSSCVDFTGALSFYMYFTTCRSIASLEFRVHEHAGP